MTMKHYCFVEVPSDVGAGERGASLGIDAVKLQAWKEQVPLFHDVPVVACPVTNRSLWTDLLPRKEARWLPEVAENCESVCRCISGELQNNRFPLVLAGDHSTAAGTIAGIKKWLGDKKLGVIWIDAHADIHSPYTTPSGNVHGMPIGAALAGDNRADARNELHPETLAAWERMKQMGGAVPSIYPEDLVYIGVRDTEAQEDHMIDRLGIKRISVQEVNQGGILWCIEEIKEHLSHCDALYISFDVDSMDPAFSEGTGTPVPNGLSPYQAESLISAMLEWEKTACLEVVEVNPLLDTRNEMAHVVVSLLTDWREVLHTRFNPKYVTEGRSEV